MMSRIADPSIWPVASKRRTAAWAKLRTKKGRNTSGQLIVEGVRQVCEALISECPVEALLAADSPEGLASARRVLAQVEHRSGEMFRLATREFLRVCDTVHSAGVAAIINWQPAGWESFPSIRARHLLFCDRLADPGNLGTLVRTAAGLGMQAVLVGSNAVELTNPKTIRASAGAIFRIPVIADVPIEPFIAWCEAHRYIVYAADLTRGRAAIPQPPAGSGGWALVIGGETSGLDAAWSKGKVQWLRIPMQRGVESFNAAVAGAILMDRLCQSGA